jgi:hypothetical protein
MRVFSLPQTLGSSSRVSSCLSKAPSFTLESKCCSSVAKSLHIRGQRGLIFSLIFGLPNSFVWISEERVLISISLEREAVVIVRNVAWCEKKFSESHYSEFQKLIAAFGVGSLVKECGWFSENSL